MKDETKMLLKLILAAEEESEEGQQRPDTKKPEKSSRAKNVEMQELEEFAKFIGAEKPSKPLTDVQKDLRKADLERARKEMYPDHEDNRNEISEVPVWAKYALTVPEASSYFHLGYNKLREIVRRDKYAEYLLWNGGRVYIKRKLFEEYLNKETEI